MNIRLLSSLSLALLMAFSTVAQEAEPAADAPQPAEVAQDSHTQAVEEFLAAMKMQQTTQETINQMLAMQVQQQPALAAFQDVMKSFLQKHLSYASIKDDLVQMYKSEFTEEEIRQLTEFYQTPVGKKAVEKLPKLSAAGAQLGMQRVQANMGELQQAIAQRQAELQGQAPAAEAPAEAPQQP